jgi:hypothetical protein
MEDQERIKRVWELPDPPPHPEMTTGVVVNPDNVKGGDFLMIACSSAVKLEISPMGPQVRRVDNDPAFGGILHVMAFCYPFIACKVITGKWKDTRMALDIRRHKLVRVDKRFVRAMQGPKPVPIERPPQPQPPGPFDPRAFPRGFLKQMARHGFVAAPPRNMGDPEAELIGVLEDSGWTIHEDLDDAQGEPPEFPDGLPVPEDNVEGAPPGQEEEPKDPSQEGGGSGSGSGDEDDEEFQGQGAPI